MPELGGPGGPLAPPIFGRSVNPISTGEGRLSPPIATGPPNVFHLPASLMADVKKVYDDLMIITLYPLNNFYVNTKCEIVPQTLVYFTRKRRRKQISIVVQLRLKKEILLNTCCLHTTMI